jgi:hypothetical protein
MALKSDCGCLGACHCRRNAPAQFAFAARTHPAPHVESVLTSPGKPLDRGTRSLMGRSFGFDFSSVRIHTDEQAARSATALGALAYTVGPHVAFAAGQYAPDSQSGRRLLAHELTHVVQQGATRGPAPSSAALSTDRGAEVEADAVAERVAGRADPSPVAARMVSRSPVAIQRTGGASTDVWGFPVTRAMCACRTRVNENITWANHAAQSYRDCDTPAHPHGPDIEACFHAANPGSVVTASTSESGVVTHAAPPSADPCERLERHADSVHETMHARRANALAGMQGAAFLHAWNLRAADPDRLTHLEPLFPAQVAAFRTKRAEGHEWAQDEVNAYTWERRFYVDVRAALAAMCP